MKTHYDESLKKEEKHLNSALFAQISSQQEKQFQDKEKALKSKLAQEDSTFKQKTEQQMENKYQ
jgi:hypothetical protein